MIQHRYGGDAEKVSEMLSELPADYLPSPAAEAKYLAKQERLRQEEIKKNKDSQEENKSGKGEGQDIQIERSARKDDEHAGREVDGEAGLRQLL